MKQVAIQGITGCFHEQAARDYFAEEQIEAVSCTSFVKLFETLKEHPEMLGAMAIENTIAGALLKNHEMLRESNLKIIGEQKIRIEQNLAVLPGEKIEDLVEIGSHPIALMQCEDWLQQHQSIKVVEKADTAASAKEIAEGQLHGRAAICGDLAAELYGLEILERGIETNKRNFTRFLILADESCAADMVDYSKVNKSTIVFTLAHSSGALSKVLTILSFYDMNLTKIQSRPIIGHEWEYQFYVDLTFDSYERYVQAIDAIRPLTNYFKSLGEYIRCENPK